MAARMIPSDVNHFNSSKAEREVFRALRSRLPDSVTVFYSLHWVHPGEHRGARNTRVAAQGEGDFVIFDPARGIMAVEVKGGNIRVQEGQWRQKNRQTGLEKTIRPAVQASGTSQRLLERVRSKVPEASSLLFCHAIWFPEWTPEREEEDLPMDSPPQLVLDENDVARPEAAIRRAFEFWRALYPHLGGIDARHAQRVVDVIAPTRGFVRSVRHSLLDREAQLVQLTREQARIVDFLDEQQHAAVHGAAGTGKTMIALEKARRLASPGETVLFLCFNRALKLHLRQHDAHPNIHFENFHGLARELTPKGTLRKAVQELLVRLADDSPLGYSHLIVDEGQDFRSEWLEWLNYWFRDRTFYVFYDRNQLLQDGGLGWLDAVPCRLVLNVNCRNTYEVGRLAWRAASLGEPSRDVRGPRPVLHPVATAADAVELTQKLIRVACKEKRIDPHDVVVLTLGTLGKDSPFHALRFAGSKLATEPTEGRVTMNTARRFKGLEAGFVIVPDVDFRRAEDPRWRRLLYVACSRARQEAHLISTVPEEDLGPAVRTFTGKDKIRSSWQALVKPLGVRLRQPGTPVTVHP